jgi:predicted lipid-binding transport protein (Tim44 family)
MLDILILAILAAFIFYKLFKILGNTKYDNELSEEAKSFFEEFRRNIMKDVGEDLVKNNNNTDYDYKADADSKEIDMVSALEASLSEDIRRVFEVLRETYDDKFNADKFLSGAKKAFELINFSYAEGDLELLKKLLSDRVYEAFADQIENLRIRERKLNLTLVSINVPEIIDAKIEKDIAYIDVKFNSEQISYISGNESDEVIEGSKTHIKKVLDGWTFTKNIKSTSKIWKVLKTDNAL